MKYAFGCHTRKSKSKYEAKGKNLVIDAWQGGVITRGIFLALNGSRFGVSTPAITFRVLFGDVVSIFHVALDHVISPDRLAAELLFDFLEASTAFHFVLSWATTCGGDFLPRQWTDTPTEAGRAMTLLSAVVAIFGATRKEEAGSARTATLLNDLGVARAFLFQPLVHLESSQSGVLVTIDCTFLSGSSAGANDFLPGVFVDTPGLSNRAPMLSGGEQTVLGAFGDEIANDSGWTQQLSTLDVADGAFRLFVHDRAAFDGLATVGHHAPASAGRSVALDRLEEASLCALRDVLAGHGLSSV